MNNWNSIETQLKGWKPRRPSPDLERRIFAPVLAGHSAAPAVNLAGLWRWAVPALGCFMLVVSSLSSRIPASHFAHLASTNFPLPLSREPGDREAAYMAHSRTACAQNSVPVTKVELSFASSSNAAGHSSFLPTNSLIQ